MALIFGNHLVEYVAKHGAIFPGQAENGILRMERRHMQ